MTKQRAFPLTVSAAVLLAGIALVPIARSDQPERKGNATAIIAAKFPRDRQFPIAAKSRIQQRAQHARRDHGEARDSVADRYNTTFNLALTPSEESELIA